MQNHHSQSITISALVYVIVTYAVTMQLILILHAEDIFGAMSLRPWLVT